MSNATLVEETLRGLPEMIEVFIAWNPDTSLPAWWESTSEFYHEFPTTHHSLTDCERFIAEQTISEMQAVLDGHLSLPGTLDTPRPAVLYRNGDIIFDDDNDAINETMKQMVSDHQSLKPETFAKEFAHYYAELVAQQRNKQ